MLGNVTDVKVTRPVDGTVRTRRWWPDTPPPVTSSQVHPAALAAALKLAGGDARRLRFLPDGSVLVANRGRG